MRALIDFTLTLNGSSTSAIQLTVLQSLHGSNFNFNFNSDAQTDNNNKGAFSAREYSMLLLLLLLAHNNCELWTRNSTLSRFPSSISGAARWN